MTFLIGVVTALAVSFQNTELRKLSNANPFFLNLLRFAFGAFLSALFITLFSQWEFPSTQFLYILLLIILLGAGTNLCYIRAYQYSEQSLVGPLFSFSIIFLVLFAFILIGEVPSSIGFIGIISVFIGTVFLEWNSRISSIKKSIKNIFYDKGSRYMIIAAFLGAIVVTFTKYSYQYISPLNLAFYVMGGLTILHVPFMFFGSFRKLYGQKRDAMFMMIAFGVGEILYYIGISLTFAIYFISIKRLSIVFDVLFGWLSGREKNISQRAIDAMFMFVGVALILILG